ncbi:MAG TPA: extracellular solute-binding protein [Victivallales bacterium]|nr:extracellular solute-binding protein [Victivallales bacterium]
MRKKIILILSLLCLTFCLSAYAGAAESINVVLEYDPMTFKWVKETVASYEKAYPENKVNLIVIKGSQANYYTKISLMLKSNQNLDVLVEDSLMLKSNVDAGELAPMDVKDWKDWNEFYPSLKKSVTINGKIYGIPLSTDARGLYYNTNIFKKAGIKMPWQPKNWNDILTAARQIKKKVPGVFPFSFNTANSGEATSMQTAEMFLYGTGNTLYKDGKWVITSKGLLSTLKFIGTVYKEHLGVRMGIALNPQYPNIVMGTLAPQQKVGIILDGCWLQGLWYKKFPKTAKIYKFIPMPTEFGQAPGYTTMSGGWDLSINSKSPRKAASLKFIKFATSKTNLINYVRLARNLATRKDVAASKEYPAELKQATKFLKFTHFRPANQNYPMVSSKLQNAVESVAIGTSPLQVMNTYANAVERAVGKDNVVRKYK